MPDPANPRGTNPLAIAARNEMRTNSLFNTDPQKARAAADTLLKLILGSSRDQGPRFEPPPMGFLDPEKGRYYGGSLPPVRHPSDPPLDLSGLSPEAQSAWVTMQDARPRAVNTIRETRAMEGGDPNIGAVHNAAWRAIVMREKDQAGQPLSLPALVETLAHELSHGVGLGDFPTGQGNARSVTAYDVDEAQRTMHQDINLPNEDELVRQKHIQMLRKK